MLTPYRSTGSAVRVRPIFVSGFKNNTRPVWGELLLIRGLGNGAVYVAPVSTRTPMIVPNLDGGPILSVGGNPNFDETLGRFKTPIPLVAVVPIDHGKIEPAPSWIPWLVGGILALAFLARGR